MAKRRVTKKAGAARAAAAKPRGRSRLSPVVELEPDARAALFRRCGWYVLAGAVAFAVVFSLLAWLRYRMYYGGRFDLGNMVQAVYNTAHGHLLEITTAGSGEPRQMSRLGAHVDPILALFALPWLAWPSPVMLLVLQCLAVATGAWPAYRLGARVTRDPRAGALLAGALLLYPALGYGVLNEFHPVTLATPLLLWAFFFAEEDRWLAALPFLVLAALSKEEVPLVLAVMGAYFALRKRSRWPLLLTALALAWFAFAVWVVIPHFNAGGTPFIDRYSAYGAGAGEMVKNALTDPGKLAGDLFALDDLKYWANLLWPFGLLPLLSPLTLLVAAPELGLNALSSVMWQRSIQFHYTAAEIPFFYAAATLGLMRLWRWLGGGWRRKEAGMRGELLTRRDLALIVLLLSLGASYVLGPLPFSLPGAHYGAKAYAKTGHAQVLDEAVAMVPPGVSVSVNNNVGSHLSARRVVYTFPDYEGAAYVVVDQSRPVVYDRTDTVLYDQALGRLVLDTRYQSVFARDKVFVFKLVGAGKGGAPDGGAPDGGATPTPSPSD